MLLYLTSPGMTFIDPIHHDTYPAIDPPRTPTSPENPSSSPAPPGRRPPLTALSYAKAGASQIAIAARSDLTSLATEIASAAKSAGKPAPHVLSIELDVQNLESVKERCRRDVKRRSAAWISSLTTQAISRDRAPSGGFRPGRVLDDVGESITAGCIGLRGRFCRC